MSIYVAREGETLGPYTELQVKEYLQAGIFTPDQLACEEGTEDWLALSDFFPTQPSRPSGAAEMIPAANVPTAGPSRVDRGPSLVAIFGVAFLGVLAAGGLLLAAWRFLMPRPAPTSTPSTATVAANTKSGITDLFTKKGHLSGEVFVVTKGGQNYKLGLVQITLYDYETIQPLLTAKNTEVATNLNELAPKIDAARTEHKRCMDAEHQAFENYLHADYNSPAKSQLDTVHKDARQAVSKASDDLYALVRVKSNYTTGAFYMRGLPASTLNTQTNSDGKFFFEVPVSGDFVVVASASRAVGDETERYYWFVHVPASNTPERSIMLSNNNLSSAGATESVVQTVD